MSLTFRLTAADIQKALADQPAPPRSYATFITVTIVLMAVVGVVAWYFLSSTHP